MTSIQPKMVSYSWPCQVNMLNISWRKGNQTMKFGQVIEYNYRDFFTHKSCRKWDRQTSSRLLFIFSRRYIWAKSNCSATYIKNISIAVNLAYNKSKQHKTLDYILIQRYIFLKLYLFSDQVIFFHMTKKSRQIFKCLQQEKSFEGKTKNISHHFKRAFTCTKLSQTWECTFKSEFEFNSFVELDLSSKLLNMPKF